MHAGAHVDEPVRPLDQRGEDVGREHVDREDVRQPVGGPDRLRLAIADAGLWMTASKRPRALT